MAIPHQKLAASLAAMKVLQDRGLIAVKSSELSRVHRERLLQAGFLSQVVRGWFILKPSQENPGDSTNWVASYWNFCARYLYERFGKDYWISPDQSLRLHAGNWSIPAQLIIRSPKGTNSVTPLPFGTSLFSILSQEPPAAEFVEEHGLRMLSLPASIIHCSMSVFHGTATDVRVALSSIVDASQLLPILLEGGHSVLAGRLAGAFRNNGQEKIADELTKAMKSAGYSVREVDPFDDSIPAGFLIRESSVYANRIKLMWQAMRSEVIACFPQAPGLPTDKQAYMNRMESLYASDAYNSLSIERYRVTPELIERVRSGQWNAHDHEGDKQQRDGLAARGYWQATQQVRESIRQILNGKNPGVIADADHGDWYRELFSPGVLAGLLRPSDLAGYRNQDVFIAQSNHLPMGPPAVREAMPALFALLQEEQEASVRAVLGHFVFVYIHPYADGNGRIARFLMNAMLASGGYPWTIIPVEERDTYMQTLEAASVEQHIAPFARFIAGLVTANMEGLGR